MLGVYCVRLSERDEVRREGSPVGLALDGTSLWNEDRSLQVVRSVDPAPHWWIS